MLETYCSAPKTLRRLRAGPSGPHIDGFAAWLAAEGYSPAVARRYLRVAAHLGQFLQLQGKTLADMDSSTAATFFRHLGDCHCPQSNGGQRNPHLLCGAKRYHDYLIRLGVCARQAAAGSGAPDPELVARFALWLRKHRGSSESTVKQYCRCAVDMLNALGDDPAQWRASSVRAYFVERVDRAGVGTAEKLVTNARAFLRFLSATGDCQADLDKAVPSFASWRLAERPRYLSKEQLNRVIAACDGDSRRHRRDRAIVLLLARLGLRAGDVAKLRLVDLEWQSGTLRVLGKGRRQVRLPLPQEVGDAIVAYLECRPKVRDCDRVFLNNIAPFGRPMRGDCVSNVVKRAMKRAGVETPAKGAHVLRHTAATQMLRHGVPLDQIGLVLRHRRIDTTAYYAKADVDLLK